MKNYERHWLKKEKQYLLIETAICLVALTTSIIALIVNILR